MNGLDEQEVQNETQYGTSLLLSAQPARGNQSSSDSTVKLINDTYAVKEEIGRGGMSRVYLAEHVRLHTYWAVKQVRRTPEANFDFLAGTNILKNLQHPLLARIVDILDNGDVVYIVEDYVQGQNLESYLAEHGKADEATGRKWFVDLCGVLQYLHQQEPNPIIYRDMKPSNIMLQPDGTIKLIDFGIAWEAKKTQNAATGSAGTAGYAAPEQLNGAIPDARTDIYALGVTMYHILTGKSPYVMSYPFKPAREENPELSQGMEHVLAKCMQEDPAKRYQSVAELLDDLNTSYRYDDAWKKVRRTNRLRGVLVAALFAASIGLMVGGHFKIAQEKEEQYASLLDQASALYVSDFSSAVDHLNQAREMFPDRIEPERSQTYALYLNGKWQECVDYGNAVLARFGEDSQTELVVASAQFELGDYSHAAENFRLGAGDSELSVDYLRDYAVCLGRLGDIDAAAEILKQLQGRGATQDVTAYVQGEVYYAQKEYVDAESSFLSALEQTKDNALAKRCYISLSNLYMDCSALARSGNSPIQAPATKCVKFLSEAVAKDALRSDSAIIEALGLAYYEAYNTDPNVPQNYLGLAADAFDAVLNMGISKDYLYTNLYGISLELKDYQRAEDALQRFEAAYPQSYKPHALRAILLISMENEKPDLERDYSEAVSEYDVAGQLIRNTDDATYYQQVSTLMDELRANGWI